MALPLSVNGIELSGYLGITNVVRNIGVNRTNNFTKVGITDGKKLSSVTLDENYIDIDFNILHDLNDKRRILAGILFTKEPFKLIIGDEPDRYYNALVEGQPSLTEMNFLGKGQIRFVIPDGVAYAIETDYFTNADPAIENLCLDSEFENRKHYWRNFNALGAKYNNSNTLIADFTDLVTIFDKENWLPKTTEMTRPVNVKIGDSVSFGVLVNIEILPTDGTTRPCTVILEERTKVGGDILYRHTFDVAVKENEWQTVKQTVQIKNEKTTALCLTEGVRGNARLRICQPQFNLGATLNPYTASKLTVSNQLEVTHYGTWRANPQIEVTMQGENGLIGLVNSNGGTLQYGDPEDVDTVRTSGKHKVVDYGWRSDALPEGVSLNDTTVEKPVMNGNNLVQGSIKWDGGEAIYPVFKGVDDIKTWHGPTVSFQIPKSANNTSDGDFISAQRLYFKNPDGLNTARGRIQYTINDENKKMFMSLIIRDSSLLNNEIVIEFWYKGKKQKEVSLSRKTYNGDFFEVHLDRMDSNKTLRWRFSQIKSLNPVNDGAFTSHDYEFIMKFPDKELTKAVWESCWFMRYSNQHHNLMYWTDSKLYWTNETIDTNVNNLFDDKDLVEIDTKTRKVFVNGVEDRTLHKLGNEYEKFQLEQGKHTIQVVASDWAVTPIVGITLRRVFL
ncbi:distal tail protein Dit [Enterococcus hailinensis]|uniref:distal tail protein Dit n=1 Tax=Enterococcus hailinensis TaxID=3238988 RepID=UPI0038B2DAA4